MEFASRGVFPYFCCVVSIGEVAGYLLKTLLQLLMSLRYF